MLCQNLMKDAEEADIHNDGSYFNLADTIDVLQKLLSEWEINDKSMGNFGKEIQACKQSMLLNRWIILRTIACMEVT